MRKPGLHSPHYAAIAYNKLLQCASAQRRWQQALAVLAMMERRQARPGAGGGQMGQDGDGKAAQTYGKW